MSRPLTVEAAGAVVRGACRLEHGARAGQPASDDVGGIEAVAPRYVVQRAHLALLLAREGATGFGMMEAGDPEAEGVLGRCVEANRRLVTRWRSCTQGRC